MNEPSNTPIGVGMSSAPAPFYQVWLKAITKPNPATYAELASSPAAKASTAYLWVFVTSLVSYGLTAVIQFAVVLIGGGDSLGSSLISLILGVPLQAGLAVLGFIISTAVVKWVSGLFKGQRTFSFDQLAYVYGAITAPITLIGIAIGSIAGFLWFVPVIGVFLGGGLILILLIYLLALDVIAVKGIADLGWGQSITSVLAIPGLLFLCACAVIVILTLTGGAVNDIFNSINQSLGQ